MSLVHVQKYGQTNNDLTGSTDMVIDKLLNKLDEKRDSKTSTLVKKIATETLCHLAASLPDKSQNIILTFQEILNNAIPNTGSSDISTFIIEYLPIVCSDRDNKTPEQKHLNFQEITKLLSAQYQNICTSENNQKMSQKILNSLESLTSLPEFPDDCLAVLLTLFNKLCSDLKQSEAASQPIASLDVSFSSLDFSAQQQKISQAAGHLAVLLPSIANAVKNGSKSENFSKTGKTGENIVNRESSRLFITFWLNCVAYELIEIPGFFGSSNALTSEWSGYFSKIVMNCPELTFNMKQSLKPQLATSVLTASNRIRIQHIRQKLIHVIQEARSKALSSKFFLASTNMDAINKKLATLDAPTCAYILSIFFVEYSKIESNPLNYRIDSAFRYFDDVTWWFS